MTLQLVGPQFKHDGRCAKYRHLISGNLVRDKGQTHSGTKTDQDIKVALEADGPLTPFARYNLVTVGAL